IALNMFQGIVNSLDVPARQAFTVEIVEVREDLSNAIALNSSMVHAARLIGPAVGGFLIYTVGEGFCFLIDGLSYLGVIAALAAMRLRPAEPPANRLRAWASLWEGLRYAATSRPIRTLLMMVAVTSATAMSLTTLMPIFAGQVLGGDELTLGWLLGASGAGALVGTVYLASRASVLGLGRVIATASAMLGVGLMLFSFSRSLVISLPLLMLTSFSLVTQMASCNTVLQTIVDDDKRGRVMALYAMAFLGVAPLGSLLVGALAAWTGAPWTVFAAGLLSIATALVFASQLAALRPLIRPIYQTKGILPTVASALESTTGLESRTRE
ncbi:MAG TPA: MFS transporter, partial [Pirellulales bacterium]|nr:MFS transporter [Pirellulales bacterium]